jgi:hypothetical protein
MLLQWFLSFLVLTGPYQTRPIQSYASKNFSIHYEKTIPSAEMKGLAGLLEERLTLYENIFGVKNNGRIDVNVYAGIGRFRRESRSPVFDDGDCFEGTIYLVYRPLSANKEKVKSILSRVVAKKILEEIPWCPMWLTESYSLYAGNDLLRFGDPVQMTMVAFTDLNEEYSRVNELANPKELYAKLAATIRFLMDRYGERKVETVIKKFSGRGTMEQFFESVFNDRITEIEKEWRRTLQLPYKDE